MAVDPRTFLTNPVVARVAQGLPGGPAVVQAADTLRDLEDCPPKITSSRITIGCPTNYAIDLIERAPKHKFMFVAEFVLEPPFDQLFSPQEAEDLAFVVKRSGRPNITYDYEEVNFYNFRTKVAKRIEYQPVTMSFYDDKRSGALSFLNKYMRIISPLSSQGASTELYKLFEESGMSFDDISRWTGSTGGYYQVDRNLRRAQGPGSGFTVPERQPGIGEFPATTIIQSIRLYHIYDGGAYLDQYTFAKPKITEFQLDDLDMTQTGDGNEIAFTFSYDALDIQTRIRAGTLRRRIEELTDAGLHSLNLPRSVGTPETFGNVRDAANGAIDATINQVQDALNGPQIGSDNETIF